MNASILVVLFFAFLALISDAEGRYYRLERPSSDWLRYKRQTHPDATVAKIPEVAFQDVSPSENTDFLVPAPSEYLTPPAAPVAPVEQFPELTVSATNPEGRWDLKYDPNDILVPPVADDGTEYSTLKQHSTPNVDLTVQQPKPEQLENLFDSFGPVTSGTQNFGQISEPNKKESVFSYVKTNPEGHFKWGVHLDDQKMEKTEAPVMPRVKRTGHMGVTGPVHTYQKTNKEAHFKWGVKHQVGHHFAG